MLLVALLEASGRQISISFNVLALPIQTCHHLQKLVGLGRSLAPPSHRRTRWRGGIEWRQQHRLFPSRRRIGVHTTLGGSRRAHASLSLTVIIAMRNICASGPSARVASLAQRKRRRVYHAVATLRLERWSVERRSGAHLRGSGHLKTASL